MFQLAGIVAGAALAAAGLAVPTADDERASDDQAAVDAAVDGFVERMVDIGFVADPDDDDDDDDDDDAGSDDALDDCFAEAGIDLPAAGDDGPFGGGTTAEAESPDMEYAPAGEPVSTDLFDLSAAIPETVAVMVSMVDESAVELMAQVVDWMGSKDAARCFERSFGDDMFDDEDGGPPLDALEPEFEFVNSGDIGIGDHSARLDMSLSMTFIVPIEFDMTMLMAQSGRSVATVMHVTSGDGPTSGVDPLNELQLVLDDLAV